MKKMKAVVYDEYGESNVLQIKQLDKPYPNDKEIMIKVHAVSINYGDLIARNFKNISHNEFNMPWIFWLIAKFSFGYKRPQRKILGNTFAGEIERVGKWVEDFKKGDQVFGYTGEKMGTYAEYLVTPRNSLISLKPSNMTYEEASTIPYGMLMAFSLLTKVNIRKGQKILIVGASGGIGSAAVQLASHYFKTDVTGVCSAEGIEFVKKLGASKVIDYKQENTTINGESYDIVFDILGRGSFSHYKPLLTSNGIYLLASFKTKKLLQMIWTSIWGNQKVICAFAAPKVKDLIFIKELIEGGKVKSIIDKSYPLDQVAEAHKYIENGIHKGSVVINI